MKLILSIFYQTTALITAIKTKNVDVVKLLLTDPKIDINIKIIPNYLLLIKFLQIIINSIPTNFFHHISFNFFMIFLILYNYHVFYLSF